MSASNFNDALPMVRLRGLGSSQARLSDLNNGQLDLLALPLVGRGNS